AMPRIEQAIFVHPPQLTGDAAERRAFLARKRAERACQQANADAYFASWSFRTVTYKAMSAADQLVDFYGDLADPRVSGWFTIFHQRYSTNTLPTWARAQPFRFLCHNGEINTIAGNGNLMRARVGRLGADWPELAADGEQLLQPLIDEDNSDSARLDNVLELLVRGGRELDHAMTMLIPPVWEGRRDLHPAVRDFYRYHAALTEPWDGPAGVVFTDGTRVAAALDRNGLRPLRYAACEDGVVFAASEVGAVRVAERGKVRRERLGPGQMLLVDPAAGGLLEDDRIKRRLAARRPYGEWIRRHQRTVTPGQPVGQAGADLLARQVAAGFSKEEQTSVLRPMANDGKEPVSSMGDDTPLAVLADRPRTVYHYLKQRFAQVTNPPIDHLREWQVMSVRTQLGPRRPILSEEPEATRLLELDGFIMYPHGLQDLVLSSKIPFGVAGLDATFAVADERPAQGGALAARLQALGDEAVEAVEGGAGLLICSDRGVDVARAPVPAVLAVGAIHHRLVAAGLRTQASLVVETDDARETHAFACLLGYGADVVCPRLAMETIAELADTGRLGRDAASAGEAQESYRHAVEDGVLKIMSKMGISTLDSYRSAQIFEAVGLAGDVIDTCLVGTPSRIGGIGLRELAADVLTRHARAFSDRPQLDSPGFIKFKRGGEYHATNPDVIEALHRTVGLEGDLGPVSPDGQGPARDGKLALGAAHLLSVATDQGRWELYQHFARLVNERPPTEPRDLLEPAWAGDPAPLGEVEPATSIVQRFFTGAMSLGALSPEAHETLAVAMNLLGASSNTGEGGEDPARYRSRGYSRDANSKAKQVASGRFGVTPEYLAFADELQIKIAQGSKPGEGGQLPGHKVTELIARLR
ncbi:MAG: glutamate synthase-related protein, partial [Actinomycetota bacterium]|nr:glutamate synthase-related protein [Actinomycetota bacterium]